MPHKANRSFFDAKRDWSNRKDLILAYYLKPYLAKVKELRRPVLIVDGFAGPGTYGDGTVGSPLIICDIAKKAMHAMKNVVVRAVCVEEDGELYGRLVKSLKPFAFAEARAGTFLNQLPEVEGLARTHTVFLYIDPYAIEGLQWEAMDRVFRYLMIGRSVEVLLNFNAFSFVRRGRAALKLAGPADTAGEPEGSADPPSVQRLNDAVGGDWWQAHLSCNAGFAAEVQAVSDGFCHRLSERFREVCQHPVKARWSDTVPKYSLIFGSRSGDALVLMNNAAIKSRDRLAETARPNPPTLFEIRPDELVPDLSQLPSAILDAAMERRRRRDLIISVIRQNFCRYTESQIIRGISDLLKQGRLKSMTGKSRINDSVEVWKP